MNCEESLNTVLKQEIARYNRLVIIIGMVYYYSGANRIELLKVPKDAVVMG
jgi:hypothetical protein